MDPIIYQVLHVASGFLLTALTFRAFAAPTPETRKRILMLSGITSLVMLVGGFGLLAKLGYKASEPWVLAKIACWLGLSALAGIAFRKPEKTGMLSLIATVLIITAIVMVYVVRVKTQTIG